MRWKHWVCEHGRNLTQVAGVESATWKPWEMQQSFDGTFDGTFGMFRMQFESITGFKG